MEGNNNILLALEMPVFLFGILSEILGLVDDSIFQTLRHLVSLGLFHLMLLCGGSLDVTPSDSVGQIEPQLL